MIELKCKTCGGNLEKTNRPGYAVCDSCGSMVTLQNINDDKLQKLLINAHRAVEEKNLSNIAKYYNLLKEEFPEDNMIETTFYSAVSKAKLNNNGQNLHEIIEEHKELFGSLDVIEKYYNVTDNREQVLERISNFLFKMAFPMGEISYSTNKYMCDVQFFNLLCEFNKKLEQLSKKYNDECIRKLISKHKQIIMIYNNKRNKTFKITYSIFLMMAIIASSIYIYVASLGYVEDVPFFIVVVLPWLGVIISKSCMVNTSDIKKSQTISKKNSNNVGKMIGEFFKVIWYGWIFVTIVATVIDTVNHGVTYLIHGIFGITLLGILPGLVVKGIVKLFKKS